MNASGNRRCRVVGCSSYGGSQYMDWHEVLAHGRCDCGWVGAVQNFPWHQSHQGPDRGYHVIAETFPKDPS